VIRLRVLRCPFRTPLTPCSFPGEFITFDAIAFDAIAFDAITFDRITLTMAEHNISGPEFAAAPCFCLSIDLHESGADELFGLTSGCSQISQFEEPIEFDKAAWATHFFLTPVVRTRLLAAHLNFPPTTIIPDRRLKSRRFRRLELRVRVELYATGGGCALKQPGEWRRKRQEKPEPVLELGKIPGKFCSGS
jgi:hypothetical protein